MATTTTQQPATSTIETEQKNDSAKKIYQKKIKKHPKNFGSKTYEILKKQETAKTAKVFENETEDTTATLNTQETEEVES